MKTYFKSIQLALFLSILSNTLSAQNPDKTLAHLWKPQQDNVYLQEVAEKIPTISPVQSIAVQNSKCYAVFEGRISALSNGAFVAEKNSPEGVRRLMPEAGDLWALSSKGIYKLSGTVWTKIDDREYVDLCIHQGKLHAATKDEIYRFENGKFSSIKPEGGYYSSDVTMLMEDGSQLHDTPVELGPIKRIESYGGTLYLLRPDKLILFDGLVVNEDFIDWGMLPSKVTRDLLSIGTRLLIGTNKGLGVLRGATLTILKGTNGLPVENTTCLEKGFDGDVWIGTSNGAVRMLENDWHYFGGDHWLPGDQVNGIAVGDKVVYVATEKGVGVIHYEPYTLQKKAAYYENHINEWGHKRLGFMHMLYQKDGEWVREVSDNDGGHTATYLAAMSYKYAATGDPTAKAEAIESFKAMIWLQKITQTEGFIARSIWSTTADKDEMGKQGSGGLPAKWYPTADGKWFWKGDTSSDEVTAHFYAVSLFYDLVAEGKEKEMAKEHLQRMASYILKCGWMMNDMDGKPTRWARWNPEYLLRPYGYNDRGINGLEALAFMHSAFSITGDSKFSNGLKQLIGWGYHTNTIRQKNTFPPATLAPWDDNLAFESYNTLLRYASDPALRSVYLRSLERTWEVKRMEHLPWYNFSYGALTGNECELDKAVKHLREMTLDCVQHNYRNSERDDLNIEPGYISYEGAKKSLSPRETSVYIGSGNATVLDGGSGGRVVREPTSFLRDYWMARYHGFIQAPETKNPELILVSKSKPGLVGAKPYDGPKRPDLY
ncbi:MAG: hypothetical protein JZU47_07425 [Prolixibacteraceae bacterium]|nr:hypothetical protein [Prolixibacteraceae bacterium]